MGRRRNRRHGRGMKVDYRHYKHPAVVFSVLGVTTLLLISVFFLDRAHNTHRWIHCGWLFLPAFGTGEACADPVSGFLSGEPHQVDGRLAEHPAAGRVPTLVFSGA